MTNTTYGKKWRPSLEIIAQDVKRVLGDGEASLETVQARTGYKIRELDKARDYLIARSEIREVEGNYQLK
jgi:hypothetical protein